MLAGGRQRPRQIFDSLALASHGVRFPTFRRWCTEVRREQRYRRGAAGLSPRGVNAAAPDPRGVNAAAPESSVSPGLPPSPASGSPSSLARPPAVPWPAPPPERILAATLEAMELALVTPDAVPPYKLPDFVKAMLAIRDLTLSEQANRRAEELHEIRLADLRSKVKTAVEDKTAGGTKSLTREDVYDLVDQVMRGAA